MHWLHISAVRFANISVGVSDVLWCMCVSLHRTGNCIHPSRSIMLSAHWSVTPLSTNNIDAQYTHHTLSHLCTWIISGQWLILMYAHTYEISMTSLYESIILYGIYKICIYRYMLQISNHKYLKFVKNCTYFKSIWLYQSVLNVIRV